MHDVGCIAAALGVLLLGCDRTEPSRPPMAGAIQDAGTMVGRDLADSGVAALPPAPPAPPGPPPGSAESLVRQRIGPLVRFHLVPVGRAAVEPARAALPLLRQHYAAYGFDLGATLEALPGSAADCTAFLGTLIGARGTLFILEAPLPCSALFGALDRRIAAAVVPLPPLGESGSPEAARRLAALLAADVGEILGLSYPCPKGKGCCPLHSSRDLSVFDARAAASCPQHASELGRIRTDAGLQ